MARGHLVKALTLTPQSVVFTPMVSPNHHLESARHQQHPLHAAVCALGRSAGTVGIEDDVAAGATLTHEFGFTVAVSFALVVAHTCDLMVHATHPPHHAPTAQKCRAHVQKRQKLGHFNVANQP